MMTQVCVENLTFQSFRILGIVSSAKVSGQRISVTPAAEFHFAKTKAPVTLSDIAATKRNLIFCQSQNNFLSVMVIQQGHEYFS